MNQFLTYMRVIKNYFCNMKYYIFIKFYIHKLTFLIIININSVDIILIINISLLN